MIWDVLGRFGTFWDVLGRFGTFADVPCETVTWPFQLERRKQRATNSPTKRPFAALEQRPGDPTARFNSGHRLAYSRLGRLQHGAHLDLHDCVPRAHARVNRGPLAHSQGISKRPLEAVTADFGNLHELPQSAQPGSRNC